MAKRSFVVLAGSHFDEAGNEYTQGKTVKSSLPLDKMFENKFKLVEKAVEEPDDDELQPVSGNPASGMNPPREMTEDSQQTMDNPSKGMRKEKGIIEARRQARAEEREAAAEVEANATANVKAGSKAATRIATEVKQDVLESDDSDLDADLRDLEEEEGVGEEEADEDEDFGVDVTDKFDGASDGGFQVFKNADGYTAVHGDEPTKALHQHKKKAAVADFLSKKGKKKSS